ncbi:MAG: hypothetical protein OEY11_06765 [Gammaproteobacteria bacterium]|nr:hypothetical protein [Gammaproteobacteria bacterium]
MDVSFFSYALLSEIILLLVVWVIFLHWRLSKKKKELLALAEPAAVEIAEEIDPFEIYLQFINRELSETLAHLNDLNENQPDDLESINMYEYRLKHLNAEQKAMFEAKGDTARFWQLYRSSIEFVYHQEAEPDELFSDIENDLSGAGKASAEAVDSNEQLEKYKVNANALMEQNDSVIELIKKYAEKNDSAELSHMVILLGSERDELARRLMLMQEEYSQMMNAPVRVDMSVNQNLLSQLERNLHNEKVDMSKVLTRQNSRVSELNDIVGNLSLELEEKKQLVKETDWVTAQLKETEHVVIILEDENNFLRQQIKELVTHT